MPDRTPLPRASSLDNRIKALDVRGSALREKRAFKGLTPEEANELDRIDEQYGRLLTVRVKTTGINEKPRKVKGLVPKATALRGRPKPSGRGTQPAVGRIGTVVARLRSNDELRISAIRAIARLTDEQRRELREAVSMDEEDRPDVVRIDTPMERETRVLSQRDRLDSLFMYEWYKEEEAQRKKDALDQARAIQGGSSSGAPIKRDVVAQTADEKLRQRLAQPPVYRQLPVAEWKALLDAYEASQKKLKKTMIKRRGSKGWARFQPGKNDPARYKKPSPKSTPREIVGHHGHRPHGPSILWPALYEHLLADGKTKAAAAAISNAAWKKKRLGMKTNTPTSVRGVVKCEEPLSPWDIVLAREAQSSP